MAKHSQVKSKRKLINPLFHLQTEKEVDEQLTNGMIKVVRKTGQLNLSGRNLNTVPKGMFAMYEIERGETEVDYDSKKLAEETWWNFKPLEFLDLSLNVLQELPGQIEIFEDLTVLNLQDNNLTTLPPQIGKLTKLTKLNLSRNKIKNLPDKFYKLTELQCLLMSNNCLECLSKDVGDLIRLQQLDLSHNNLTNLPSGIGFLIPLIDLNFSYNKLTELPPDLVNLRVLSKLDVTHNNLKFLPNMGELRKLCFLYAQHNDIEVLPSFEGCENIQQMYFGNNCLKEVPKNFCENMSQLKILDLRDNKIAELPDEIAMLQHLTRLDLTNNELANLPNTLTLLPHLQNLQIEGNILKQIRSDIIKGGTCRILKHLKENLDNELKIEKPVLHVRSNLEKCIFPNRYIMKHSRALNLTLKKLATIPDLVFQEAKAAEVTSVDLCKNILRDVPSGLNLLGDTVTELNLSVNQITAVPDFLSHFTKLQYLDLSNNLLSDLSKEMRNLKYLRELVISNNRFTHIPNCVFEMEGLEIFQAENNQLTEINVNGLKCLKRIAIINLSNNNINQVPPELGNVTQIRSLELKGNSFRQPRYAILEKGTDTLMSYLRDRIPK